MTSDDLVKRACALLEASVHNGTPRLAPTTCVRLVATIEAVADSSWVEEIKKMAKDDPQQALNALQAIVAEDEMRRVQGEAKAAGEQAVIVRTALRKP